MVNGRRERGRPKKDDSFSNTMELRVTVEHAKMLDELTAVLGKNRGEIMREALERYYDLKVMGQMTYF